MSASERRGAARTSVVWESLREVFGASSDVLDIGGGTGGFAVRVAELGHQVRVIDPSPDALAALGRRAQEFNVADRVAGQQGDLSTLLDVAGPDSADVVLCHGVLEIVDDPAAALATIAEVLRPGGTLSLLVNQRHAAVVARAIAGHFGQARAILDGESVGRAGHRFTSEELTGHLEQAGFTIGSVHGIRVFSDLVPGSLLDLEPGSTQALLELERAVATRPEYLSLATQVHVLATH
ncbi:SAM-dependent methyltransferase [Nocardioides daedukensis]|uniref:SAM-dependent methyltransferase n=1 Tax=Nocardioides daedukensis TaxID=634462 RepID=A0A7Y9UP90_9ACTN|nr:methyltransferase [Nocardioides daedukensis]NYG57987.1 SAM-dependent methyltransferase [Nocardioides daedukensis]